MHFVVWQIWCIWFVCIQIGYFSFVNLSNIKFVYTHVTLFVTHTYSEVVTDEVVAEALQLAPVYYDLLFLENRTTAQSISRIAPNYHPLIGPTCAYQMKYVNLYVFKLWWRNLYVFILTIHILCLFIFVIGRQWLEPSVFWSFSHF